MANSDKTQLEAELLKAQIEKVQAEKDVLKRTTPLTEAIKIFGSLVVGLGGAIVAIFGFQFAEIKAEKFKLEADKAALAKDAASKETDLVKRKRDSLKREVDSMANALMQSQKTFAQITDSIAAINKERDPVLVSKKLQVLQEKTNAADIDLRAAFPVSGRTAPANVRKPLQTAIEELFAPRAATRGAAYDQLMNYYANDPNLVPSLLQYANNNIGNENGIYNTLVVLGHLNYRNVPNEYFAQIRSFAEQVRNNGPKTADRVDKLLERIPR